MITRLASPSVCVIDDEEPEYGPILTALMGLGLGCVHVRGRNDDPLPPKPFDALRMVLVDLHLSGQVGKAAASHTANVVRHVVSATGGPVLMIIWSKYAADPAGDASLPPEDQPTEAQLFKDELWRSDPRFKTRLVFVEMPKPKPPDRPHDWVGALKAGIEAILSQFEAFDVLWAWEASIRGASIEVSEMLVGLTEDLTAAEPKIDDQLKLMLRLLAQQQGGPDCSPATAPRHLLTVFSQIGLDNLEAAAAVANLGPHASWLAEKVGDEAKNQQRSAKLNTVLHTSPVTPAFAEFMPGTVYDVLDNKAMASATGFTADSLQRDCFEGDPDKSTAFAAFKLQTKPVLVEITPACDFHQNQRHCALLVAGLACPVDMLKKAKSKDAYKKTPVFEDRYSIPPANIGLVFCGRYRFTAHLGEHLPWLQPRFRLREALITDIRNWHANQMSRVGYLVF